MSFSLQGEGSWFFLRATGIEACCLHEFIGFLFVIKIDRIYQVNFTKLKQYMFKDYEKVSLCGALYEFIGFLFVIKKIDRIYQVNFAKLKQNMFLSKY